MSPARGRRRAARRPRGAARSWEPRRRPSRSRTQDVPTSLDYVAAATPSPLPGACAACRPRHRLDLIAPTIALLLAINIFPLIWTVRLRFTNFRANQPNAPVEFVGIRTYVRILTDEDIWMTMQATAHFVIWTLVLQVVIGFGLAWLINRKFRGNDLWTTIIVLPMMLSPAVVGDFWTFLYQPHIGLFNAVVGFLRGVYRRASR